MNVQVYQLQQMSDSAELGPKVLEIYEAHFGASAPYEINLPTTLLKQLKTTAEGKKFSTTMFDEAQVS